MSIFGNILSKIFPSSHPAVAAAQAAPTPAPADTPAAVPAADTAPPAEAMPPVDVDAVISAMPNASALHWQTSIGDLLKVLDLDSSLAARKQLAQELGYTGSTEDSASMNIWLHQQVVAQLQANGGQVPDRMKG